MTAAGEVGYLTEVFNDMVERLRRGREALDRASQELRERNVELEDLLGRLADQAAAGRPEPGEARVLEADVLTRGIGGRRSERSMAVTSTMPVSSSAATSTGGA